MINAEELAICKRRGHDFDGWSLSESWKQCKACGMWVRERRVIEEREDEPPEAELDPVVKLQKIRTKT